ncbi:MAG: 4Fe-4S binding protein [Chloroflexi bacterium]|nr:4Fe-4S binding protein [Chloroflexota bacterium]
MSPSRKSIIKQSTKKFFQEGRKADGYSFYDFLHGYLYIKWPYLYISVGTGEHRLNRILAPLFMFLTSTLAPFRDDEPEDSGMAFANSYHGKVVPIEEAKRLVSIQEDIVIKNIEPVIPFTRAKDIILQNPDRIAVLDCPCRMSRENPCTPLDVCIIVGDPFVNFILDHQPEKARMISSDEAMDILQEEHDRGHVSHAFFKDAMLNRFYAICNCCSCCCGAFQAQRNGTPMLMTSGYTALVDSTLCEGCGTCSQFCQFSAIEMVEKKAVIQAEVCYGCGVCVDKCESQAITFNLDSAKGVPLEIHKLMEQAQLVS